MAGEVGSCLHGLLKDWMDGWMWEDGLKGRQGTNSVGYNLLNNCI